jgi:zona occludens toxin
MLSFQVGTPGSGKSYEAAVFQILPALKAGRKVITNIPIRIDVLRSINHAYADLLEIRTSRRGFVFSDISDYQDDWEHPEIPGQRALFVIDEAHEALPLKGVSSEVEHWFARHRHAGHDVVLITQDEGKIFKNIRDLAEISVKTKKLLLFGSQRRYLRLVYYGSKAKGTPFAKEFRQYDEQLCGLYQSFTAGGAAFKAKVVPIWLNWKVLAFAAFVIYSFGNFFANGAHWMPGVRAEQPKKVEARPVQQSAESVAAPISTAALPSVEKPLDKTRHPYFERQVRIEGSLGDGFGLVYWLREGKRVFQSSELVGYTIKGLAACYLEATHRRTGDVFIISCHGSETVEIEEKKPKRRGRVSS